MKTLLTIWLASCLSLIATPDWADSINETYIGSNKKFYATVLTETNNQGSYYEWRETKKFNEYSKIDATLIDSITISDILYTVDANHTDPNTQPIVTTNILNQDKNVILSTLFTQFRMPLVPTKKPEWIKRLSWLNGDIILDNKLVVVEKGTLTGLKIHVEHLTTIPLDDTIAQVHTDSDSFYLLIKVEGDDDYNTHIIHLSSEVSKQLRDRINLLEEYVFIKSFKTFDEANKFGLRMIKSSQAKNFYRLNPEIWLSNEAEANSLPYSLVHRPLDSVIEPEQIKRLDAAIGINTSTIKSENFVEKWIPFPPRLTDSEPNQGIDENEMPEDLIEEKIK